MPLGTEVGLGPGHVMLDGDPAPPRKGAHHPPPLPRLFVPERSPISATAELVFSINNFTTENMITKTKSLR